MILKWVQYGWERPELSDINVSGMEVSALSAIFEANNAMIGTWKVSSKYENFLSCWAIKWNLSQKNGSNMEGVFKIQKFPVMLGPHMKYTTLEWKGNVV